jgi:hypothetical protein
MAGRIIAPIACGLLIGHGAGDLSTNVLSGAFAVGAGAILFIVYLSIGIAERRS